MGGTVKPDSHSKPDHALEQWQRRLLPAMRGAIVLLACFFLVVSLVQYFLLYGDIRQEPSMIPGTLANLEKGMPDSQRTNFDYLDWKVRVLLETDAMRLRHQHVNSSQLMRTWTRYTGFLVGMVLALLGAFFILGKLSEPSSQVSGEAPGVKVAVVSSSPGIILAVLGCFLMILTLYFHTDFTVEDRPVYLTRGAGAVLKSRTLPRPEVLEGQPADSSQSDDGFPAPPK